MSGRRLTIMTPTYNRAYTLGKLYESLKGQSCKEFVWLIIDDGSTDNTHELVKSFISENAVDITYHFQENRGKYIAHNTGVRLCETELFVCVDSDDELYPNAVERTLSLWEKYRGDKRVAGIVSPKDTDSTSYFRNEPEKSTLMNLYNKGHLVGETMLVFRADVLKRHLFPEIDGENFMSENVIYYQIDQHYLLATQDEYLYKARYRDDGLTRNIKQIQWNNPKTTLIMYKAIAALQKDLVTAVKSYGAYLAWKKVRSLQPYSEGFPVRLHVALLGSMLYGHYYRLFAKQKKALEVSE